MANLSDVYDSFKTTPHPNTIKCNIDINSYDTTCPKCGNSGYSATNDGGSVGGCTKCNITYKSKIIKKNKSKKTTYNSKIIGKSYYLKSNNIK